MLEHNSFYTQPDEEPAKEGPGFHPKAGLGQMALGYSHLLITKTLLS
jgi:hypothetical protein